MSFSWACSEARKEWFGIDAVFNTRKFIHKYRLENSTSKESVTTAYSNTCSDLVREHRLENFPSQEGVTTEWIKDDTRSRLRY